MNETHDSAGNLLPHAAGVRFARWVFLLAGIFGMLEVLPLYFMEHAIYGTEPPSITHPEFYYGFVGIALAWQIAFLLIARDPLRFRPLMPAIFLEKLLYPLAVFILHALGRVPMQTLLISSGDLVWLALFIAAWVKTSSA